MYPTVSVVISTYNWPEALELCLMSLAKQSVLPDEVLIADDGSTTATTQLINRIKKQLPLPLIHIWHEDEGFRRTTILNKAFAKASGDYIIQLDGDVILHPEFVKDHLAIARKGYFTAGARVTTSEALGKSLLKEKRIAVSAWEKGSKNLLNGLHLPLISKFFRNYKSREKDIYYVKGCNMAFWKPDLVKVNGYDESFTGWGYEDSDISIRLYRAGVKKQYLKMAGIIFHLWHKEYPRDREAENMKLLRLTSERKDARVNRGLDQWMNTPLTKPQL